MYSDADLVQIRRREFEQRAAEHRRAAALTRCRRAQRIARLRSLLQRLLLRKPAPECRAVAATTAAATCCA